MKKSLIFVAVAVILLGVYLAYVYRDEAPVQLTPMVAPATPPAAEPEADEEPLIRFPVPQPSTEDDTEALAEAPAQPPPLPPLDESDEAVAETLDQLHDPLVNDTLFKNEDIVRRFVVSVDNLTQPKIALKHLPTQAPAGKFVVTDGGEQGVFIDPANGRRYRPYVKFLTEIDTATLISAYVRFYPLIQEAYTGLGYPDAYFNDRLVEVIDHLLATPEIDGPIRLIQPSVFYKFADPALEQRSAGQKLLIRMGSDNAHEVKAKLREIKHLLVRQGKDH